MALEIRISSQKYLSRISMLEGQLALLKNLEAEYNSLQSQVPSFMGESDAVADMRQNVVENVARVEKAIEACNAAIKTLQANVTSMENAGQNVESIIQDSINIARTLM
jgi:chromosome segregation ATPase